MILALPPQCLTIVSMSGAHAVGKTTLVQDLVATLIGQGYSAVPVGSFSASLFNRLCAAHPEIRGYDDIDAQGHRGWFQRNLPEACAAAVERAALSLNCAMRQRVLLADRWFPDILAHTMVASPKDAALQSQVSFLCTSRHRKLHATLRDRYGLTREINVLVPLSSVRFDVPKSADKFRATHSQESIERECVDCWPRTMSSAPHLKITESSRTGRVKQVLQALVSFTPKEQ